MQLKDVVATGRELRAGTEIYRRGEKKSLTRAWLRGTVVGPPAFPVERSLNFHKFILQFLSRGWQRCGDQSWKGSQVPGLAWWAFVCHWVAMGVRIWGLREGGPGRRQLGLCLWFSSLVCSLSSVLR